MDLRGPEVPGTIGNKKSLMDSRKADVIKNTPSISAKCWAIYDVNKMS